MLCVQIKDATAKIKELADVRTQSMEDVDTVLRVYHSGIVSGELEVGDSHQFEKLLKKHRDSSLSRPEQLTNGANTNGTATPTPITA